LITWLVEREHAVVGCVAVVAIGASVGVRRAGGVQALVERLQHDHARKHAFARRSILFSINSVLSWAFQLVTTPRHAT
jgi:hypothetical protein